ncbi:hypothetical protein VTO42DRAFT_7686 [Malbranchea cinnamomea]
MRSSNFESIHLVVVEKWLARCICSMASTRGSLRTQMIKRIRLDGYAAVGGNRGSNRLPCLMRSSNFESRQFPIARSPSLTCSLARARAFVIRSSARDVAYSALICFHREAACLVSDRLRVFRTLASRLWYMRVNRNWSRRFQSFWLSSVDPLGSSCSCSRISSASISCASPRIWVLQLR